MSLRSLISLATGLAAALSTPAGAVPLRICAEPDNLPMSQQSTRSGAEIEVAELLAKELKRPLEGNETVLSIDKARRLLKFEPQHSWRGSR